jgi:hypothetical protein
MDTLEQMEERLINSTKWYKVLVILTFVVLVIYPLSLIGEMYNRILDICRSDIWKEM